MLAQWQRAERFVFVADDVEVNGLTRFVAWSTLFEHAPDGF